MAVVAGKFETKGTHLFFVDPTGSEPTVTKLTCPTGIDPVGAGTKDRIDTTCLDETGGYRTYVGGYAEATEVSVPFVLYKGDGSHQALFALRDSNALVSWLLGLSDSTAVPDLDSDDQLTPPADRTCANFSAYVSNVSISIATNEVVRGTLTIQPSGATTWHWTA